MMMASEPKAKEQLIIAVVVRSSEARTNCDYIDNNDGGGGNDDDDTYYYNFVSLFENLKI